MIALSYHIMYSAIHYFSRAGTVICLPVEVHALPARYPEVSRAIAKTKGRPFWD